MRKWPLFAALALLLLACSDGDPEAPLLGDCSSCNTNPSPGGGISGGGDASLGEDGGDAGIDGNNLDAGNLDAIDMVDVGVNPDAGNPTDASDRVDVGVPNP